jgi:hypothetical protein
MKHWQVMIVPLQSNPIMPMPISIVAMPCKNSSDWMKRWQIMTVPLQSNPIMPMPTPIEGLY